MRKIKAKNSHSNSRRIQEDATKLIIKLITEYTEFCKVITNVELNNKIEEKNVNINFNGIILDFCLMKERLELPTFGL